MGTEWRKEINASLNKVAVRVGPHKFKDVRVDSYKALEEKSGVGLDRKLDQLRENYKRSGKTKSSIKRLSKMDVIDADPQLRKLYEGVVDGLVRQYCKQF